MDKIAVVTGANLGIGRATVDSLLATGWEVWGFDLTEPETPPNVSRGGFYHHAICNIADPNSIKNAFDLVRRTTDTLGALVCNAGVTIIGELQEITIEEVDMMYQVDLRGQWLTIREAVSLLQRKASVDDPSRNGFYSAFKQAVHTIANIYAVELAPTGVVVNTVAPGTIDTRMSREAAEKAAARSGSKFRVSGVSPLGRIGKPQDVADAIMFFLGDTANYINGTVLAVDGGTRAAYTGVSTNAFK
jgi:NAD(P)-dependent dehydrogenase (short-subunit alcohol dehydrogenase family)